ncbi:MAG: hypothetical protein NC231_12535 [Bacillus sp. (in: Bacteria)]|nr:hypothetical protein [Bacillus sp. (in: firmicutes)]MCM1427922.1 hypothetical protein [Eubacterium sp.]
MNILRKILYGLLLFFVLCCALIGLCAMNPEMSEKIAETFHIEEKEDDSSEPEIETASDTDADTDADTDGEDGQDGNVAAANEQPSESTITTGESGNIERPVYDTPKNPTSNEAQPVSTRTNPPVYGITAPADVAGKNGYQPIQDSSSEIDDEEAQWLLNEIDEGQTGDGLTFDIRFYPYYAMLDGAGQHLYRQIYANAMALNDRFAPVEDVSVNSLRNIFAAVYNDHPELFWMDTAYSCKYKRNGQCAEIDLQFNETAQNLESEKAKFEEKAKAITDGARSQGSSYDREKYVHDNLIKQVDYVASAPMNQSAYSALVNGRTVCAGYARAYQYMMQQLGIPCYYCTGYAGEKHAWNIVALDDGYYNVDATWDDTGEGTYDYFNKSDSDYAGTHLRQELSINLPPCNGTMYRNLEAESDGNGDGTDEDADTDTVVDYRRRLSDLGLSPSSSLATLQDYYNTCYNTITQTGKGEYIFQTVISGEPVFQGVYSAYQTEGYRQAYMDSALEQLGAEAYLMAWMIEELQDGYYLVTHDVYIE